MRPWALCAAILLCGCGPSTLDLSSSSAEAILKNGGGLTVSAKDFSSSTLESMATAAAEGGAMLRVVDANELSSSSMESIAAKAPGHVTFE
ncbi:hypothetical protein [Sphingomonas sp.]|uniref:hypothetical protein n=1 Tax=Sphingomonas sp. TaxID=28214 RepID=UPI001B1DAD21|nr:hypothetical protein [Sphingomonas sp.]MBO9715057.1 hypothetical protein [Sphingomonas sp.]